MKSSEGRVWAKRKSVKQIWSDALLYAVERQANTGSLIVACELIADAQTITSWQVALDYRSSVETMVIAHYDSDGFNRLYSAGIA